MEWRELNRAMWDERVPIHVASSFYDVEGFKAGRSTLRPFEAAEMGPIDGAELLHLQCHFGLDTLSWARLGARVTGLDFSAPAVAAARQLAEEIGVSARFVCADVYDSVTALGRRFDVVYTGRGALMWLPDIERWAETIAALLEPGGRFYLVEFHPFIDVFSYEDLTVTTDYFHDPAGSVSESSGTYADASAETQQNRSVEWRHPLSDVIGALLRHGLRLESLNEHDYTLYRHWPWLEPRPDGGYALPDGTPRLPLMYSLRARR